MKDQWIEWFQEKQRQFFYGITIIIAVFFLSFQIFGKFHNHGPSQALTANQAYESWLLDGDAFAKLEKVLNTQPDLETKFGALIADRFISQNKGGEAEPFAENVFQRVLKFTPEHTTFAEGSLLIAKGNFREALTEAISLKTHLDENSLLYGFNLVRIASLYRELDYYDQELACLEELEQYLKKDDATTKILMECYMEGELTLFDYISQRKSCQTFR